MLFSTIRAGSMTAAFVSGFFFKKEVRKAILARSSFFVLYYAFEILLKVTLCSWR